MATEVTTMIIKLMNGTLNFVDTEVVAATVGELREEKGLTGQIAVGDVIASDSTALTENVRVAHIQEAMKGGRLQ